MKKKELGQYYTRNASYIFNGLLEIYPDRCIIVDPFAGEFDLLNLIKDSHPIEAYDIDPKIEGTIHQDTLLNPPDYKGKWILTNPPYVARNLSKDKTLFDKYNLDDLYKIALNTMIGCEGGSIVIPLNFFSNDRSVIRERFLSQYKIVRLNIFEEQVFDDTAYTVCSFSFVRSDNRIKEQIIDTYFYPRKKNHQIKISEEYGYMIGGDFFFRMMGEDDLGLSRLLKGGKPNSKLFLRAIDGGSPENKISLQIAEPFYGIKSDRVFASIVLPDNITLSLQQQKEICEEFNSLINRKREEFNSLFLTNFRNSSKTYARKRISFNLAYGIISYLIKRKLHIRKKVKPLF